MVGAGAPEQWIRGSVDGGDGALSYLRTGGDGPSVVFAHGLGDSGACWSRVAGALEGRFDVVMLDARGHGESTADGPVRADGGADDIRRALDALELDRPVLVGHSVGARAAAAFAARAQGRLAGLVLEDPVKARLPATGEASDARRARFRAQVEAWAAMSEAELAAVGAAQHPTWDPVELPAWIAAKRAVRPDALPVFEEPWSDLIARISVPVLILHGEADLGSLFDAAAAREAAALNPRIETRMVPAAGHNVRRENFSGFMDALDAALGRWTWDADANRRDCRRPTP